MKMLIRADDIGYSDGVNCGILYAAKGGVMKSAGLMPNMEEAQHGFDMLKDMDICIGQHTNLCVGYPCADPSLISSLLQESGEFKTSREFRTAFQNGEDLIRIDEAVIEIDAQYQRFKEITGRQPAYFEAHAIASRNLSVALEKVAERYHLPYSDMSPGQPYGTYCGKRIHQCDMRSMEAQYDPYETLLDAIRNADEEVVNVFVCHPGYVDDDLIRHSSLTINRAKEAAFLHKASLAEMLKEKGVELVSYEDIRNE